MFLVLSYLLPVSVHLCVHAYVYFLGFSLLVYARVRSFTLQRERLVHVLRPGHLPLSYPVGRRQRYGRHSAQRDVHCLRGRALGGACVRGDSFLV